jgi:hypothetical protein
MPPRGTVCLSEYSKHVAFSQPKLNISIHDTLGITAPLHLLSLPLQSHHRQFASNKGKMSRHLAHRKRSYSMTNIESSEDLEPDSDSDCIQPCRHHPVAPQYPNGNATKHLKTLSEFVKTVAEGLSRITFPRTQQQYSSVHVLLISWMDDDLGTLADLLRLKHIFDHLYRFSTTYFRIPSNDTPDFDLEEVISSTKSLHGRNDDGLLIVCYGGHGEIDKSTQHSIWKAWRFPPKLDSPAVSPRIDWSELKDRLMKSKGDVLFILDCCYAAGAVQTSAPETRGSAELPTSQRQ